MATIKAGDKVRIIKNDGFHFLKVGTIGIVERVDGDYYNVRGRPVDGKHPWVYQMMPKDQLEPFPKVKEKDNSNERNTSLYGI